MEAAFEELGSQFAAAVIAGDYDAAHKFLAPWLQASLPPGEMKAMVQRALGDLPDPVKFKLDGNSCALTDLEPTEYSPPTNPLSAEITEANYRKWMVITFEPDSEEQTGYDACLDLWMALVEVKGALRIGYLEPADPD